VIYMTEPPSSWGTRNLEKPNNRAKYKD
jgi:hypothetical protein